MTYESLSSVFRLRIIKTEEDYVAAKSLWEDYIADAKSNPRVSASVIQYAEVLSLLMEKYEQGELETENEEEDDGAPEPEDGDYVTEDRINFFMVGDNWNPDFRRTEKPSIRVPLGGPWQPAVTDRMEREMFWPNVWEYSPDTGYQLLSLEDNE